MHKAMKLFVYVGAAYVAYQVARQVNRFLVLPLAAKIPGASKLAAYLA